MKKNEDFKLFFSIALISQVSYCGIPLTYYSVEVENQLTTINRLSKEKSELDVCNRFNSTFSLWEKNNKKNKTFIIFTKYEFRHLVLTAIKKGDFELIDLYFKNLDHKILQLFPSIEIKLYKTNYLSLISVVLIKITKLLWRLRGYPRVEKINVLKTKNLNKIYSKIRYEIIKKIRNTLLYPFLYKSFWYSILVVKNSKRSNNNYLTAFPNPGAGIGHQIANWTAGLWLAKIFNLKYAYSPFSTEEWDRFLAFEIMRFHIIN